MSFNYQRHSALISPAASVLLTLTSVLPAKLDITSLMADVIRAQIHVKPAPAFHHAPDVKQDLILNQITVGCVRAAVIAAPLFRIAPAAVIDTPYRMVPVFIMVTHSDTLYS